MTRHPLLRAAIVVAMLVAGCGAADRSGGADPIIGPIELVVHLPDERWEARGPLVDAGEICPTGRRHTLSWYDPVTGDALRHHQIEVLERNLPGPMGRIDVIALVDHVCDDGSGAFVVAENQARGDWEVRSGTGAYGALHGRGRVSFVVDFHAHPSELFVIADLGPPDAGLPEGAV